MSFLSVYLFVQGITEESLNLVLENGALTPHGKECKTLKYFSCRDLEKGQQAIKSGKPLTLRMSLSPVHPWVLGSGSGNASPRAKSCGHLLVWRKCQWNRGCTYSFRYDLWLLPPVMQSWVPVTETSGLQSLKIQYLLSGAWTESLPPPALDLKELLPDVSILPFRLYSAHVAMWPSVSWENLPSFPSSFSHSRLCPPEWLPWLEERVQQALWVDLATKVQVDQL